RSVIYDVSNAPNVAATPNITYAYDGQGILYSKGKLTSVSVAGASFSSTYSYDEFDALARVKRSTQTTDGHPYTFSYGSNLAGSLTSETYPSGRVVTTSYDTAERVSN